MRATKKFIIALPILTFLIILGLLLFIGKNVSAKTNTAENVSLILRLTQDHNSKKIDVSDAVAVRRTALSVPKESPNSTHRLILTDETTKKEILSIPLRFISELHGVPPYPKSEERTGTLPKKLPVPMAIAEIPYQEGTSISVRDMTNRTLYHLPRERINRALIENSKSEYRNSKQSLNPNDQNSKRFENLIFGNLNLFRISDLGFRVYTNEQDPLPPPSPPPTLGDGYFDVLFVSSHYTDRTKFISDVDSMGNFLLNVSPYSDLKSKIRIQRLFTTENLNCNYDVFITRLITCDDMKVFQVAANTPHDTIVVVENNAKYGGSGGLIAVSYRDVSAWAKEVVVHEMGHSVGDLADEYEYGYNWGGSSDPPYANCSLSPCKWQGIEGTGCFKGCSYNNLYRPTYNSCLMRTLTPDNGFKFDNVDREVMRSIISSYLTEIPFTPTPAQPIPTYTLTPTPTVIPTRTPTPTIKWFKPKLNFIFPTLRPTITFIKPSIRPTISFRGR